MQTGYTTLLMVAEAFEKKSTVYVFRFADAVKLKEQHSDDE